jgi:hypothetical protein
MTNNERLVLGLLASRGKTGVATYSGNKAFHPSVEDGSEYAEALQSLERFGLAKYFYPPKSVTGVYVLTDEGVERAEQENRSAVRWGGCVGCMQVMCVCMRKIACLVASDPLGPEGVNHPVGCLGTHD